MAVAAIVQARMGSTRLPGKVLCRIGDRPMIGHVVDRLGRVPEIDVVVVATSTDASEEPLLAYLHTEGVRVERGSALDVLDRYHTAARAVGADVIVRITGDCPLISPSVTSRVVRAYLDDAGCDYASNTLRRTFPRGLDTEVLGREVLERAHREARSPADREHVTSYVWSNPSRFRLVNVTDAFDRHALRWTVDTAEDLEFVRRVVGELAPLDRDFDYEDVLALLARRPELSAINRHVEQKRYGE